MGLGAMKMADMEEYIRVVYALLNGEMTEAEVEPGVRKKIKFLNPELGLINIKDPDPTAHLRPRPEGTADDGASRRRLEDSDVRRAGRPRRAERHEENLDRKRPPRRATCIPLAGSGAACCAMAKRWTALACAPQAGPRAAVLLHRYADLDMEGWINTSPVPTA